MVERDDVTIRPARRHDVPVLGDIERAAGRQFAEIGMDEVAADEPFSEEVLQEYVDDGRAWVAEVAGGAIAYALALVVDGGGHLEQLSVHPDYQRRGLGRTLIERVAEWARSKGMGTLTLLTFRDVPWNAPYYARLGFDYLPDADLPPDLQRLRAHEAELGLDIQSRVAMRLNVLTD